MLLRGASQRIKRRSVGFCRLCVRTCSQIFFTTPGRDICAAPTNAASGADSANSGSFVIK